MKKLSVEDGGDMIIALKNEITRSPEVRYDHRLHVVPMVPKRMRCYDISRILGHSPRTVEYCVKQFNDHGFVSVMDRPRAGRPSRISDEVMDRIHKNLRRDP